jgi:hypothetical protein
MPDTSLGRLLIVQVLGVATVALALIPAGAHLFSLISKMRLPPDQYLTAQRAYDNWALFGIAIVAAILLTALHTWLVANNTRAMLLSALACLGVLATQIIFWVYTYPMNLASSNWTAVPDNFEVARRQWEYSHAASAVILFAVLLAFVLSALLADSAQAAADR